MFSAIDVSSLKNSTNTTKVHIAISGRCDRLRIQKFAFFIVLLTLYEDIVLT